LFLEVRPIRIQIIKNNWDLETYRKNLKKYICNPKYGKNNSIQIVISEY